jgi:hypothetical protein
LPVESIWKIWLLFLYSLKPLFASTPNIIWFDEL